MQQAELISGIFRILKKYDCQSLQSLARNKSFLEDIRTIQGDFIGLATAGDRLLAISTNEILTLVVDNDNSLQFSEASHIFDGVNV